jgi:peptidoglycan/LPS O-acetylase OafA/YrhL
VQDHEEKYSDLPLTLSTSLPVPSSVKQIDALQLLRAVAVILVIWCHAN